MRRMPKPKIRHPKCAELWKENLRSFSMSVGFHIHLSKAMLEFLCAVAEDVDWDRSLYFQNAGPRDSFIASGRSLEKRGLIVLKSEEAIEAQKYQQPIHEKTCWLLTPAGKCIVELLKMAGMFVEADAAISKKARRA